MTWLLFKVNQLGDNVIFLPVVQSLMRARPQDRIVVVTSPVAAPLFETTCPGVTVCTFPTVDFNGAWRRPWKLPHLLHQMRRFDPDVAVVADDQGNVAHLLARFCGARFCIGRKLEGRWLGPLLHEQVPLPQEWAPAMQNWHIVQAALRRAGLPAMPEATPPAPDLSAFGKIPHGCILIHAGASRAYKRWPMGRYIELANRLCQEWPVMWITQGDPMEAALAPAIHQEKPDSLSMFVALMAGARFFVGNNSGPMNLASALGIPGIIFNGPSLPRWDPLWYKEGFDILRDPQLACQPCDHYQKPVNRCQNIEHPMACMDRWTVATVHDRITVLLKTRSAAASPP